MFVPDEEAALRIEAWDAARAAGPGAGLWPGWAPAAPRTALVLPGEAGLCLSWAPPGLGQPIAARSGGTLPGAVHLRWAEAAAAGLPVAPGEPPRLRAEAEDGSCAVPWAGAALWVLDPGAAEPAALAAALHRDRFAAWWARQAGPAAAGEAPPDPFDGAPERAALLVVEGRLLRAAVEAGPGGTVERALQVALVRRERRADLPEEAIRREQQRESALGVPAYVGWRCASGLAGVPALPGALIEALGELERQSSARRALYGGWALAELLDRLEAEAAPETAARPRAWAGRAVYPEGWKAALTSGRAADLDALLEAHVRFDGGSRDDAALQAALQAGGHGAALQATRAAAAEAAAARAALVERILGGEGTLVVFDVRQLGPGRVQAPEPAQAVHAGMSVYPAGATFDFPSATRLCFDRLALAEDRRSGLLQVRVQAQLAFSAGGGALQADQEAVFEQGLALRLPGLSVQARSGSIRAIDGGYLIRVLR